MDASLRSRRDFGALEVRRLQAARLFAQGHPQAEIVRRLRVSRPTAHRWYRAWRRHGRQGLKGAGRAGRKSRLGLQARQRLEAALLEGPAAWGFATHLWTLERVAAVICKTCHVPYHPRHVRRVLGSLGWSRQRPARRARERDEKAIAHWVRVRWPEIKKNRQVKAWLGLLDESGFSQRPPVRATWAPKGRPPCLREPFNWQRLSGISLVLTTPDARRLRWFLTFHPGGVRSPYLVRFLKALRRHRRRRLLLWDCLPARRSRLAQNALEQPRRWLSVESLPAYAPQLNPVEPPWAYLDTTLLANRPHDKLQHLRRRVRRGLAHLGRGFLRYTKLF